MPRIARLALFCATASLVLGAPALAQTRADDTRFATAQDRFDRELATFRAEFERYQTARNDRRNNRQQNYDDRSGYSDERDEGDYDPARSYRSDSRYQERVLATNERVYRGSDGRYYCKRTDGTTGIIVNTNSGVFGNDIDSGNSRTVGSILQSILGGGQATSNTQVRCR